MDAKRPALDEISARQPAANEKRKQEAKQQEQGVVVSESAIVQQSQGEAWVAVHQSVGECRRQLWRPMSQQSENCVPRE